MAENTKNPARRKGDLTEGNVFKTLVVFSIPILLTNVLNQLYNMADSIIVGQFVGADALAAVGANTFITMLMVSIFVGAGMGGGVYVSQLYGARKEDEISRAFNCMYCLIALLAAITGILGAVLATPIMHLMNTPDNIFGDARDYFRIYCLGLPGLAVYSAGSAALRSIGDSKAPLYFLIFSAICNVALNLLFVVVFKMGVQGVAWATLIAEYLSAALVLLRTGTSKFAKIVINFKTLRIHLPTAKIIMKLGIPSALQMAVSSVGNVLVQTYINAFGSAAIAAGTAVMRLDGFVIMPVQAIGMSLSIFFGQNLAAKKHERLHKATLTGSGMAIILSLALGFVLFLFPEQLLSIFTTDQSVLDLGGQMIDILAFFYWSMALFNCFSGIMRGAGDTFTVMIISMIGTILRVPLTWILAIRPEPNVYSGIYWAMVICNILMCVLAIAYYFTGRWKKKVVVTIDD